MEIMRKKKKPSNWAEIIKDFLVGLLPITQQALAHSQNLIDEEDNTMQDVIKMTKYHTAKGQKDDIVVKELSDGFDFFYGGTFKKFLNSKVAKEILRVHETELMDLRWVEFFGKLWYIRHHFKPNDDLLKALGESPVLKVLLADESLASLKDPNEWDGELLHGLLLRCHDAAQTKDSEEPEDEPEAKRKSAEASVDEPAEKKTTEVTALHSNQLGHLG